MVESGIGPTVGLEVRAFVRPPRSASGTVPVLPSALASPPCPLALFPSTPHPPAGAPPVRTPVPRVPLSLCLLPPFYSPAVGVAPRIIPPLLLPP